MNKILSYAILPLLLLTYPIFSNSTNEYLFDTLSLENGLSNSSVSSIQQDSKGFLWFGTQNGLNRYDGYDFIHYNHDTFNSNSIPHGLVQSLFIDNDDIIWVGTYNGISRFDPSSGIFTNYEYDLDNENSLSNNVVTAIVKDDRGTIWVGTLGGLNRLDTETGNFTRYLNDPDSSNSLMHDIIRSILIDSQNRIWIGNLLGIDLFDEQTEGFIHYPYIENERNSFPSPYVMKILEKDSNTLWVGTWDGGLTELDINKKTYKNRSLGDNRVYTMESDGNNQLWIGTWGGGLHIINKNDDTLIELKKDETKRASLSSDIIYSLFKDDSGIMWVGTNGNGISKLNLQKRDFSFLSYQKSSEMSLSLGKIDAIFEDSQGLLWIGIYSGGLNVYDKKTGNIKYFTLDENKRNSLSNNVVSHIMEDRRGTIWISTNEGINIFNREEENFQRFRLDPLEDTNATYTYTTLYEDKQSNIWIGSHNNGLFKYESKSGEITHYNNKKEDHSSISNNLIYSILERENGQFFIGTNNGLNLMNRETGEFQRILLDKNKPNGINNNNIRVLLEDKEGMMWLGTGGGGINYYNDEKKTFNHLTTREGLSNNFIMSMEEGLNEKIWVGTKYGISIIDKKNKNIEILNNEDGLMNMEFNLGSFVGNDGSIYMGSLGEISKFETSNTMQNKTIPPVYINSVEINGDLYPSFSPYNKKDRLVIDYKGSNYISFNFVALNYLSPEKTQYAHKLEGFDKDWILDDNRKYALYTNLNPGEYIFRVKAANNDGFWNEEGVSQIIRITPPLWRTKIAYTIYILLVAGLLILIIQMRTNYLKIQKLEELNKAEERYRHLNIYLSNILNSMTSQIIGVDDKLNITQWNYCAEKETGISEPEAKGIKIDLAYPNLQMNKNKILDSINNNKVISERSKKITKLNKKLYEDFTVYPIDTNGIKGAVIRIDDVTEKIKLEEILIHNEKMLSVGGLAAGMAHEINNPLAGLIQSASVLKNRLFNDLSNHANVKAAYESNSSEESIVKYMKIRDIPKILETINISGKRIAEIVENMLIFAQKKDKLSSFHDIEELFNRAIELASSDQDLLNEHNFKLIKIKKEFEKNMPLVACDNSRIQQVLLNIIRNGVEAMRMAKTVNPQFTFRIKLDSQNNKVIIEIEDNGPGIDNETQKRVFEPFFTTKQIGIGRGLGLSLSYFIITENHNGEIEVSSIFGEFTKFTIRLPV